MIVESNKSNFSVVDEVMRVLKQYPEFELLLLKHEPMLLLPGLEIDPAHRKVYCSNQEISLTAKEYDQIYQKIWKEEAFGNANNAIACHVHNLREKIGRILPEGCFVIRCVREVGYCFEADSEYIAAT